MHIKKGDKVIVNCGKDKSKTGEVIEILAAKDRAIVKGLNLVKKHTKPNAANPQGGIVETEAPIHISNLNLVDPKSGEATRIGRKRDENNNLVRYSKKSGEEIK
ncbi:MAG: 50S ribosomal protein L24 [Marinifilaceae bacterium]|nr:50S ribosomal protein L24 [Marinilabiliaceae bacterium JC040]MCT4600685.1 50S ribosomal protein L24 [Marinifilaceae bacterium]